MALVTAHKNPVFGVVRGPDLRSRFQIYLNRAAATTHLYLSLPLSPTWKVTNGPRRIQYIVCYSRYVYPIKFISMSQFDDHGLPISVALSTDEAIESEPVVRSEPVIQSRPVVDNESIVESEPVVKNEPVVESKSNIENESDTESESDIESGPMVELEEVEAIVRDLEELSSQLAQCKVRLGSPDKNLSYNVSICRRSSEYIRSSSP